MNDLHAAQREVVQAYGRQHGASIVRDSEFVAADGSVRYAQGRSAAVNSAKRAMQAVRKTICAIPSTYYVPKTSVVDRGFGQ